ncbi:SNF2-related protein [Haloferula sp. A504]|uniref:SNF2-related protein n=1 Tax=Haloferula sp. A504 TaxID=3373601 RepID=UPI0031BC4BD6|nr:SNF2 family helicase [Verrucomicrobiaceae bacterium E54]
MEWSEAWVRQQAGWQAFKRGKELAAAGAAGSFRRRGAIASGVFKRGKSRLRCVVKEQDGHLTVECGCPANRSTGEICEHGVALALTTPGERSEAAMVEEAPVVPEASVPTAAWRIRLPERCAEMLVAGRLQLRVEPVDEPVTPADGRLGQFLVRHGAGQGGIVSVSQETMVEALRALGGHPRVQTEGGRQVGFAVDTLEPLVLSDSEASDGAIQIEIDAPAPRIFALGDDTGGVVARGDFIQIGRLPVETPSPAWRQQVGRLCDACRLELPEREFLDEIEAWLDVFSRPMAGWLGKLHFEEAVPQHRITIEGSLNALEATLELRYGEDPFQADPELASAGLPRINGSHLLVRSRRREGDPASRLEQARWTREDAGRFHLRDPEGVPLWLADGLPELKKSAEVVIGERLGRVLERLHVVTPQLDLVSAESLACELSFQTQHGRSLDPAKVRAILRKGQRTMKTRDGAVVVVRAELSEIVEPLLADLGLVSVEQRFTLTKAQRFLISKIQEEKTEVPDRKSLKDTLKTLKGTGFRGQLRGYQEEGFRWLVERVTELSGALLGDEMGLGKTIQTIALLCALKARRDRFRALVLMPTSLIGNWEAELERFAPGLKVHRHMGAGRDDRRDEAGSADVLLTSYGTFQRDRAFHLANHYDLAVCDEASLLRNPDSQLSRAVAKLQADRRLALSGTPVENRLEDLWSIFRFVAPGYLGARKDFTQRYDGEDAGPSSRRRLGLRISPFYLRRTKERVAPELPEKLVVDEWLELSEPARRLYQEVATGALEELETIDSEAAARMHLLTALLRLRQICLSPALVSEEEPLESVKTEWLGRLLEERHAAGAKTLVFSQFAGFLRRLEEDGGLPADRILRLDGSTRNRTELVEAFQSGPGSAVFLISLKAGGYGLNLTAADTVVHLDPWWNPAVENQATDRAHRIGQSKPVSVYRLLARDSVEERVLKIQLQKRKAMDVASGRAEPEPGEQWLNGDLESLIR